MRFPLAGKIGVLTVLSTAFYTYVGQLVPQKEVHPPEVVELAADMTTGDLVEVGKGVFEGKGMCGTCHTIGRSGSLRFPDLAGISTRAGERVPGMGALEYMAQSLYAPDAFIVPGFTAGMPQIDKPPIDLTDQEIRAVIAYLQSLGGTPEMTMETPIPFAGGAAPAAGEAQLAAAAAGEAARQDAEVAIAAAAGEDLVARYGCGDCHGEGKRSASLAALGQRLDRRALIGALAAHESLSGGEELAAAGWQRATLAEIEQLADRMAAGEAP